MGSVHINLVELCELNVKVGRAELMNLLDSAGGLLSELVAGKVQNLETLAVVLLIQCLQFLVLRCELSLPSVPKCSQFLHIQLANIMIFAGLSSFLYGLLGKFRVWSCFYFVLSPLIRTFAGELARDSMNIIDIILLAVALAMDCFTVSIVSGLTDYGHQENRLSTEGQTVIKRPVPSVTWVYRMALLFGLFQALMPLLGWLGIIHFETYIEAYDHWIAFSLLVFIGGKMVWESLGDEEEQHFNPRRLHTQLILAVATSIDALAVGISFALTGYTILSQLTIPLIIIGIVSFLFSLAGYHLGRRFGKPIRKKMKPELIGGIILISIGLKILFF